MKQPARQSVKQGSLMGLGQRRNQPTSSLMGFLVKIHGHMITCHGRPFCSLMGPSSSYQATSSCSLLLRKGGRGRGERKVFKNVSSSFARPLLGTPAEHQAKINPKPQKIKKILPSPAQNKEMTKKNKVKQADIIKITRRRLRWCPKGMRAKRAPLSDCCFCICRPAKQVLVCAGTCQPQF